MIQTVAPTRPDLSSVTGLLAHIAALPPAQAAEATARVDAALERRAPEARLALGVLALDLAGRSDAASDAASDATSDATDDVLIVPELRTVRLSA